MLLRTEGSALRLVMREQESGGKREGPKFQQSFNSKTNKLFVCRLILPAFSTLFSQVLFFLLFSVALFFRVSHS